MSEQQYTECEKWAKLGDRVNGILELTEFLNEKGIILSEYPPDSKRLYPISKQTIDLIYECFGIDYNKLEAERKDMLKSIQENQ